MVERKVADGMQIKRYIEHELGPEVLSSIQRLRNACFPDHQVPRSYGKQLPHIRFLAQDADQVIGYLGIDHRVMRFGDRVHSVFGLIDLCVAEDRRHQGIGSALIDAATECATGAGIDLLLLIAHDPRIYTRNGFIELDARCSWLRIDEHTNFGVAVEQICNELMFKPLSRNLNLSGPIDFLGYMF
jgi:GNAT superfamily N-acetyltransferase